MPETIATELRTAAKKLRALATAAAHEDRTRWEVGHTLGSKSRVVVDNHQQPTVLIETWAQHREQVDDYLAAFASPAVGLAVADWLDHAAASAIWSHGLFADSDSPDEFVQPHALAVARAILGTA